MRQNTLYGLTVGGLIPFIIGIVHQLTPEVLPPWNWLALVIPYYGAVILSFLGGIQWGVSLSNSQSSRPKWLIVSNVVALIAFASLLLPSHKMSIIMLFIGYGVALAVDIKIFQSVTPPSGYLTLRIVITTIVCALLLINIISN